MIPTLPPGREEAPVTGAVGPVFAWRPATATRRLDEGFRLLALNVSRIIGSEPRRSVVVLSAHASDGRSFAAASLARALATIMPPVLLADGDPLGAGMQESGGISAAGIPLGNGHTRQLGLEPEAEQPGRHPLWVLEYARAHLRKRGDFTTELLAEIDRATAGGMTVVVDTPACANSSLGFHLAAAATGVIYLARRRVEHPEVHRSIRAQLDLLGARVLGVVFNET